jgi:hypothetical protein
MVEAVRDLEAVRHPSSGLGPTLIFICLKFFHPTLKSLFSVAADADKTGQEAYA